MKDLLAQLTTREEIAWLEQFLLAEPQGDFPMHDRLVDGMYVRTIEIPKGAVLTGAIHLRAHISVILKGDITIVTETGTERIVAPRLIVSPPGTKRVGHANEDTIWVTIHATPLTDIEQVPASLTTTVYKELA